jgi:hypothetical protein
LTDNIVAHNIGDVEYRFTQSARKHRIAQGRALFVLVNFLPEEMPHFVPGERKLFWQGFDDRGLELEIVGIQIGTIVLVIHVMPSKFRGGQDGLQA